MESHDPSGSRGFESHPLRQLGCGYIAREFISGFSIDKFNFKYKYKEGELMETIQDFFGQMFEEAKNDEDPFGRNRDLANILQPYGRRVVDLILHELLARKTEGKLYNDNARGAPVFHLIDVMVKFATPKHAQQLAEMLLWDEIAITECRSVRYKLLGCLERIGDASVIPFLRQFSQNVERMEYTDRTKSEDEPTIPVVEFNKHDLGDVAKAISACQRRNPVPLQTKS